MPVSPAAKLTFADDAPNSSRSVLPLTSKLPPLGPAGPVALVLICKPRSAPAPARLALLPARSSIEEVEGNWIPLPPRGPSSLVLMPLYNRRPSLSSWIAPRRSLR